MLRRTLIVPCLIGCDDFDGKVTASNCDNNFLVIGWGASGGSREYAEAVGGGGGVDVNKN